MGSEHDPRSAPVLVPIRSLGPAHRGRIATHLLALDADDRYLRFGYTATDEQIGRYVADLDFDRDDIFGIYNRKLELIAVAHLAFSRDPDASQCAEFGVSVLQKTRGRGYGGRLFERAAIHALSENTAMLKIARKAGAKLERFGTETEAHLRLPPATLDTRMSELVVEHFAQTDYRLKQQVKSFWDFLAGVQETRQGVRAARHKSGS